MGIKTAEVQFISRSGEELCTCIPAARSAEVGVPASSGELGVLLISCSVCCSPCEPRNDDKTYFLDLKIQKRENIKYRRDECACGNYGG